METIFKNLRTAYLKHVRVADLGSDAEEDAEEDDETRKQRNCRLQRKTSVC